MSTQNEIRRVRRTNLDHIAKRLRAEIGTLTRTICINLDTSVCAAENLPISEADSQFDELKSKWAELNQAVAEIAAIDEALR